MRYLSREEIVSCAVGVHHWEEGPRGLLPLRFPNRTLEAYGVKDAWHNRARCTAGIVLGIRTDSEWIELAANIGEGVDRLPGYFNLLADGAFRSYLGEHKPVPKIAGRMPCGDGRLLRNVELYLPHTRSTWIEALGMDEGSCYEALPPRPTFLALGDSITQGMDASHPSMSYAAVAARRLGWALHNNGVGGYIFEAGSLPELPCPRPVLITVAYGTNDWSGARDVMFEPRSFLARLRALYPSAPVAVLEPLWRNHGGRGEAEVNGRGHTLSDCRSAIAAAASAFEGMSLVKMESLLPSGPAFLPDGVHPNTSGHVAYGENLAFALGRASQ